MEWERKDLGISWFQTVLFLIEVILPGLCAFVLTMAQISDHALLFSRVGPGAGVSSNLASLFLSDTFGLLLVHAAITQIYNTIFVISIATLYRTGLFRARAKAILAGLRKGTVAATSFFVKAVATVGGCIAVLPLAILLLGDLGKLELSMMLLDGGVSWAAGTVFIAMFCDLAGAVPVREDASGRGFVGANRKRLLLLAVGRFCEAAALIALINGIFVSAVVLTDFRWVLLVKVATTNAVTVVTHVAQPVVHLVVWDKYRSF
jgi:hypothetical protein